MLKTRYHIDPDLHLTLRYPSKETFLYIYNENMYPDVTKIPKKLTKVGKEQVLKRFITNKTKLSDGNNNQTNFNQAKEETLDLKQASGINTIEKFEQSVEFLRNNDATLSSRVCSVLQHNYNFRGNIEKDRLPQDDKLYNQTQFSPEIIDSNNEKHYYIFSAKYLTKINNDNLINKIKNQTMDQIKETISLIKKDLEEHVLHLKEPIHSKSNIPMKNKLSNNCDNNLKEENKIVNKSNQHVKDINQNHVKIENVLKNEKNAKKDSSEHDENFIESTCSLYGINCGESKNNEYSNCNMENTNVALKKKSVDSYLKPGQRKLKIETVPYTSDSMKSNLVELKRCVFLDGTVDSSSSSEDESSTLKRRRTSKKEYTSNFSRYSALPITFCSSPVPKSQEYPCK